jgi:hypothetical protein
MEKNQGLGYLINLTQIKSGSSDLEVRFKDNSLESILEDLKIIKAQIEILELNVISLLKENK